MCQLDIPVAADYYRHSTIALIKQAVLLLNIAYLFPKYVIFEFTDQSIAHNRYADPGCYHIKYFVFC